MFSVKKAVTVGLVGAILNFAVTTGHITVDIATLGMVFLVVGAGMLVLRALPAVLSALGHVTDALKE